MPAETIVHSTPAPSVGRHVNIHWQQYDICREPATRCTSVTEPASPALDHGPVAAIVVGVDGTGFWVRTFPPPWYSDFPVHLYLPLREGVNARITHPTIFNLFWQWPPRV